MAKILLVEDDNNLREIYEARLMAEGYEIVSARDGEEALTVAMKEKPDLIISDVMMPKISGFDMLDILRTTEETKNAKVIMMTALSQAEDKARAEKLGADRYLVKSQVTLEDVAKVAKQVLEGEPAAPVELPSPQLSGSAAPTAHMTPPPMPQSTAPTAMPVTAQPVPMPAAGDPVPPPEPTPPPPSEPAPDPGQPIPTPPPDPGPVPEPGAPPAQAPAPVSDPIPTMPQASQPADDAASDDDEDDNAEHKKKVIQPINNLHEDPQEKLSLLLEKEKEREQMTQTVHDMVQTAQSTVSTAPGVDAATSEAPVPPPPVAGTAPVSDPNAIAL